MICKNLSSIRLYFSLSSAFIISSSVISAVKLSYSWQATSRNSATLSSKMSFCDVRLLITRVRVSKVFLLQEISCSFTRLLCFAFLYRSWHLLNCLMRLRLSISCWLNLVFNSCFPFSRRSVVAQVLTSVYSSARDKLIGLGVVLNRGPL